LFILSFYHFIMYPFIIIHYHSPCFSSSLSHEAQASNCPSHTLTLLPHRHYHFYLALIVIRH
jgi:hypothetical protein